MQSLVRQTDRRAADELRTTVEASIVGAELLNAHVDELALRYPEERPTLVIDAELRSPTGSFVVARRGGRAVGCGAYRRLDSRTAEIKHMYVVPEERGTGAGRALLRVLERLATLGGYVQIRLETGSRQPEAIGPYRSEGYVSIDRYGEFVDNPLSVCFEKELPKHRRAVNSS